jgi:hypothetical protein
MVNIIEDGQPIDNYQFDLQNLYSTFSMLTTEVKGDVKCDMEWNQFMALVEGGYLPV